MSVFSKLLLSGSTSGKAVKVAATSIGSGTTIHTAVSGAVAFDEVYLWASNTDTVARSITIGWGGTTDPDDLILKTVVLPPLSPPIPIVTGLPLNGGLVVKAAADTANVVLLSGYVNRIQ